MRPAEMTDDVTGAWLDRATPPCACTLMVALAPEAARRGQAVQLPEPQFTPLLNRIAMLRRPSIEVSADTLDRLLAADEATLARAFACVRAQRIEEREPGYAYALTRDEIAIAMACATATAEAPWPHLVLDVEEVAALEAYLEVIGREPPEPPMPVMPPSGEALAAETQSVESLALEAVEVPHGT